MSIFRVHDGEAVELSDAEVTAKLESLRQGDILECTRLPFVRAIDAGASEGDVHPSDEGLVSGDRALDPGQIVVISQDCDLERYPDVEPFVVVAPTIDDAALHADVSKIPSSRLYPLPGGTQLVDMRLVASVDKRALFSEHVIYRQHPMSDAHRTLLRRWLGARFGRLAFSTEIDRKIVQPIGRILRKLAEDANFARVFKSVEVFGLHHTAGTTMCSLMLLVNAERLTANGADASLATALQKKIYGKIASSTVTKQDGYSCTVQIVTADQIRADELLAHAPVLFDL